MSERPEMPTLHMTPEQVERLNEAGQRIARAANDAMQAMEQACARSLSTIREKLAEIDASDYELRT